MHSDERETIFLANYDSSKYPKPSVTTDAVVFTICDKKEGGKKSTRRPKKVLQVLLIKRKGYPFKDSWALPGGFLHMDESLDQCVFRELGEEAGVKDIYLEQLYTWGDVDRDPRTRVISISYMALIHKNRENIMAGSDAKEAHWFTIERKRYDSRIQNFTEISFTSDDEKYEFQIDFEDHKWLSKDKKIAFDHGKIIEYALRRMESKINYTSIAFSMLPEKFTLTELQMVYEAILGKELLPAGFRRKIKDMVIETEEYEQGKPWRPAKLFRFNEKWKDDLL